MKVAEGLALAVGVGSALSEPALAQDQNKTPAGQGALDTTSFNVPGTRSAAPAGIYFATAVTNRISPQDAIAQAGLALLVGVNGADPFFTYPIGKKPEAGAAQTLAVTNAALPDLTNTVATINREAQRQLSSLRMLRLDPDKLPDLTNALNSVGIAGQENDAITKQALGGGYARMDAGQLDKAKSKLGALDTEVALHSSGPTRLDLQLGIAYRLARIKFVENYGTIFDSSVKEAVTDLKAHGARVNTAYTPAADLVQAVVNSRTNIAAAATEAYSKFPGYGAAQAAAEASLASLHPAARPAAEAALKASKEGYMARVAEAERNFDPQLVAAARNVTEKGTLGTIDISSSAGRMLALTAAYLQGVKPIGEAKAQESFLRQAQAALTASPFAADGLKILDAAARTPTTVLYAPTVHDLKALAGSVGGLPANQQVAALLVTHGSATGDYTAFQEFSRRAKLSTEILGTTATSIGLGLYSEKATQDALSKVGPEKSASGDLTAEQMKKRVAAAQRLIYGADPELALADAKKLVTEQAPVVVTTVGTTQQQATQDQLLTAKLKALPAEATVDTVKKTVLGSDHPNKQQILELAEKYNTAYSAGTEGAVNRAVEAAGYAPVVDGVKATAKLIGGLFSKPKTNAPVATPPAQAPESKGFSDERFFSENPASNPELVKAVAEQLRLKSALNKAIKNNVPQGSPLDAIKGLFK
jgi:hypothetical protein